MTEPSVPHPQRARAIFLLTVATFIWGLSFLLLEAIDRVEARVLPGMDPWLKTACAVGPRFLLAALIIAIWNYRTILRIQPREWKQGIGLGLFTGLGLLFQVHGLQYTDASVSAFLTQVYAVLIPLWVAWHTRRPPKRSIIAACVLVIVGVVILVKLDFRQFQLGRGEIETLIGSLFFMGQILWLERAEFAGNQVSRVSVIMFSVLGLGFGCAALALAPRISDLGALVHSPSWIGYTLLLTGPCTLFCFTVMNAWQPKITASEAGLIYTLEPVSASLLALFLPAWLSGWSDIEYANESMTWNLIVGGVLIVAANLLVLPGSAKVERAADGK